MKHSNPIKGVAHLADVKSPLKALKIDQPDADGQGPETVRRGKKRGGEKKPGHGDPN